MRKELKGRINKGSRVLVMDKAAAKIIRSLLNYPFSIDILKSRKLSPCNLPALISHPDFIKLIRDKNHDVAVLPWTADLEAAVFLEQSFFNKKSPNSIKILKLFRQITEKELKSYCTIRGLNTWTSQMPASIGFIRLLDREHPEIVHGLVRSSEEVENISSQAHAKKTQKRKPGKN